MRKVLGLAAMAAAALGGVVVAPSSGGITPEERASMLNERLNAQRDDTGTWRIDITKGASAAPRGQDYGNGWDSPVTNRAARRRFPGGGWSVKQGQRMARKRRNQARNKRAHRG